MKTRSIIIGCLCLLIFSCKKEDDFAKPITIHNGLNGIVQKGPFVSGSNVMIQELDESLNPSGKSYSTTTNDDFGSFTTESKITADIVEIISTGFYFNEITGKISEAPLSLRAISNLKDDKICNINILTTLAKNRIIYLIKNENLAFNDAKKKAENEVLKVFKIHSDSINFNELDISKSGNANAMLLAISCIFQQNKSVGELSEIISHFILDFEPDGIINSNDIKQLLVVGSDDANKNQIRENLKLRYATIPPFELYIKQLAPLRVSQTTPQNEEKEVTINLKTIDIYFNKEIDTLTIIDNISLTANNNMVVPIKIAFAIQENLDHKVSIILSTDLLSFAQYTVEIKNAIQSIGGDSLSNDYSFSFKTKNIVVESNITIGPLQITMVNIPAGTYIMGSPTSEFGRDDDETQHQVTLNSFQMSKYEITKIQYATYLNAAGIKPSITDSYYDLEYQNNQWIVSNHWYQNHPIPLTRERASAFAAFVGGSLPTEEQWEYACRAGTTTTFNTGNCLHFTQASFKSGNYEYSDKYYVCDEIYFIPSDAGNVGSYNANYFGLYDMHGSLSEHCIQSPYRRPFMYPTRGGSYNDAAIRCRSAQRNSDHQFAGCRIVVNP